MAQGTRGRWVRVAATGLGMLVCTGLVGCMNADKDKKDKTAKQPPPGLPGTPGLPNGASAKAPTPNQFGTGGIQQTGGIGQPVDRTGMNTLKTQAPQPNYGGANYNAPATIGAPANPNPGFVPSPLPGAGYQPTGGAAAPGGFTGYNNTNYSPSPVPPGGRAASNSPPAPSLTNIDIVPPPPPMSPGLTAAGAPSADVFPIAPPLPPVPPLATNANAFGPK